MEISRYVYFFMTGNVAYVDYKRSPIPEGGLVIPIRVSFHHDEDIILPKMDNVLKENYEEVIEIEANLESDDECTIALIPS